MGRCRQPAPASALSRHSCWRCLGFASQVWLVPRVPRRLRPVASGARASQAASPALAPARPTPPGVAQPFAFEAPLLAPAASGASALCRFSYRFRCPPPRDETASVALSLPPRGGWPARLAHGAWQQRFPHAQTSIRTRAFHWPMRVAYTRKMARCFQVVMAVHSLLADQMLEGIL